MCRQRVCLAPPLYRDISLTRYIPSRLSESPYVQALPIVTLKPIMGPGVPLSFKYKRSLLNVVGRVNYCECDC